MPAAYFVHVEQVWPGSRARCRTLPKFMGWDVRLSPASRSPADIIPICQSSKWFIQVKASRGIPRLKGYEVKRLMDLANNKGGLPVVSTFQSFRGGFSTGNYSILFYVLDSWQSIYPMKFLERREQFTSGFSTSSPR